MLFTHSYQAIFFFFVFLLLNNVYFEHPQHYKKDDNKRTQKTLYMKIFVDELDFLMKTVIIQ